jgi:hypothetical protein
MGGVRCSALWRREEGDSESGWRMVLKRCGHQRGMALLFLVNFHGGLLAEGLSWNTHTRFARGMTVALKEGWKGEMGLVWTEAGMHLVGVILASKSPSWQPHPRPLRLHRRR